MSTAVEGDGVTQDRQCTDKVIQWRVRVNSKMSENGRVTYTVVIPL